MALALGGTLLAVSTCGIAQIPQGSGTLQQENRTSSMRSAPESSASAVYESLKPQSRDTAGNARRSTAGEGRMTDGTGAFNDGLYRTGAGSGAGSNK